MNENTKKWCEQILQSVLANSNKKIILVAGASSSGKSFSSKLLCDYLNDNKVSAKVITADSYYKGVSKTIVQKMLLNNAYDQTVKAKEPEIIKAVRSAIEIGPLPEKFCEKNYNKVVENLSEIFPTDTAKTMTEQLKQELTNINFDEPFAIDFVSLARDINTLTEQPNQTVTTPLYSFQTSEIYYPDENKVKGSDKQIYIFEGIYALRPELVGSINEEKVIKSAIDCNLKTLLSRKFNRDIKTGRSTLTPEQTILSFITQVMPSYYDYILPTLKSAEFVLNSSLTEEEIKSKETSNQIKYKLTEESLKLLNSLNLIKLYDKVQTDYYFSDNSSHSNNIIVRMREVDKEATKLTINVNTKEGSTIHRQIEEYDLKRNLSQSNREINHLIDRFKNSGFTLDKIIAKKREIYQYKDITFKVDDVKNLSKFIEFDDYKNFTAINLIKKLKLSNVCKSPYYDLINSLSKSAHSEKEYKFLVDRLPEECKDCAKLTQLYLDINQNSGIFKTIFNIKNFEGISTARIRIIQKNGAKQFFLTLKSNGLLERDEYETEIDEPLAVALSKNAVSGLQKNRYVLHKNGFKFEFDEYLGKLSPLKTVEVETEQIDHQNYQKIAQTLTDELHLKIKDVTMDEKYKNNQLAKEANYEKYHSEF